MLQPAFRALATLGALHCMIDQRLVTTFLTNLRGPERPVSIDAMPVTDVMVLSGMYGNVTFAAISYAGRLAVTVLCDPDRVPDRELLARALQAELDALSDNGSGGPAPQGGRTEAQREG